MVVVVVWPWFGGVIIVLVIWVVKFGFSLIITGCTVFTISVIFLFINSGISFFISICCFWILISSISFLWTTSFLFFSSSVFFSIVLLIVSLATSISSFLLLLSITFCISLITFSHFFCSFWILSTSVLISCLVATISFVQTFLNSFCSFWRTFLPERISSSRSFISFSIFSLITWSVDFLSCSTFVVSVFCFSTIAWEVCLICAARSFFFTSNVSFSMFTDVCLISPSFVSIVFLSSMIFNWHSFFFSVCSWMFLFISSILAGLFSTFSWSLASINFLLHVEISLASTTILPWESLISFLSCATILCFITCSDLTLSSTSLLTAILCWIASIFAFSSNIIFLQASRSCSDLTILIVFSISTIFLSQVWTVAFSFSIVFWICLHSLSTIALSCLFTLIVLVPIGLRV